MTALKDAVQRFIKRKAQGFEIQSDIEQLWKTERKKGKEPELFRDEFIDEMVAGGYSQNHARTIIRSIGDKLGVQGFRMRSRRSDANGPGSRGYDSGEEADLVDEALKLAGGMTRHEVSQLIAKLASILE